MPVPKKVADWLSTGFKRFKPVPESAKARDVKQTPLVAALATAFAATAAADDFMFTRFEVKKHPETKWIRADFVGFKDGKLLLDHRDQTLNTLPQSGTAGTFSGFNLGGLGGAPSISQIPMKIIESVKFDGKNDWLTVVMKSGDVVRGHAESLTQTTLRIKDKEKPIRISAVREIVATDDPSEPRPEPE